ncbi:hypothetical protein K466DRAFT_177381 [Polyporus arcularius HHB13444]|uniref:Uncharacterized protein n=1 Tax=Polyporus arcularius HHB13444 TaxID=1314778 RepID=A0A5C3PIN9_9APHY|nr:hypothetical protein K466DRAFT_177381 [Polyporus arcularius HHB13444]
MQRHDSCLSRFVVDPCTGNHNYRELPRQKTRPRGSNSVPRHWNTYLGAGRRGHVRHSDRYLNRRRRKDSATASTSPDSKAVKAKPGKCPRASSRTGSNCSH